MALSSKSIFSSTLTVFPQMQASRPVKFSHIDFKSAFTPENWSITQENTLVSAPSNRFNICPTDEHASIKINDDFAIKHERKMMAFKHLLRKEGENANVDFALIDAIQRLGIDYHFQDEIDAILQRQSIVPITCNDHNCLHDLALQFRLLRQQGYYVSSGVFDKFKDKESKFEQKLSCDIKGLMGLYEASQLSIGGAEDHVLDEAGEYSYQILNSWMASLDCSQAKVIENTLNFPHHKNLARFMAKYFNKDHFQMAGWLNELQELANIDFKMVQCQYQLEILQISRWWKELGLSKELKFARSQPVKWYMWSMATLTDPSWSEQRIDLTKPISFIYIIDDIFDVHGTIDELSLFTEVVNRWDVDAIDKLPDYMRICFKALDDLTNEIGYKVYKQYGWNPVHSLRQSWVILCKAFLAEARWFASGEAPNAEEYLRNGIVSSGVHVVLVHIFYLLGHGVTRESIEFIDNNPPIISSTATILRLWDDLGSAKDEDQDGNDGSYVQCYMKEYKGSSVENARKEVTKMISDAWKQLNQECLFQNPLISAKFTKSCLNLARMVPLMYNYDDDQRLPLLEHHVKSLLYESASVPCELK